MNGVDNGTSLGQAHSLADTVASADPTGVDKPDLGAVLLALLSKHLGVLVRVQRQESLAEAGRESGNGLSDTHLGTGDLGGVTRDEVVHGLLRSQTGDGRNDTSGIASEEDDILGVATDGRHLHVIDVSQGVANTGVGSQTQVVVVDHTVDVGVVEVLDVLNNGAELDSIENIGFISASETVTLGVAAALNVEDVVVGPNVFIVTDELALGVR